MNDTRSWMEYAVALGAEIDRLELALTKVATYSPRGSLNANGPIPVGALSRDIETMRSIARRALVNQSAPTPGAKP